MPEAFGDQHSLPWASCHVLRRDSAPSFLDPSNLVMTVMSTKCLVCVSFSCGSVYTQGQSVKTMLKLYEERPH